MASAAGTAGALPPGIVKCSSTPWAWAVITRTLHQDEWPSYRETCYTCVLCAYYKNVVCGVPARMPKLWQGDLEGHSTTKSHLKFEKMIDPCTSTQAMAEALEQQHQRGEPATAAAGESPAATSGAASTPPASFHEVQRLQELEAAVAGLQVTCNELRQMNEAQRLSTQIQHAAMERRLEEQDEALQRLQEVGWEQGRHGGWQWRS